MTELMRRAESYIPPSSSACVNTSGMEPRSNQADRSCPSRKVIGRRGLEIHESETERRSGAGAGGLTLAGAPNVFQGIFRQAISAMAMSKHLLRVPRSSRQLENSNRRRESTYMQENDSIFVMMPNRFLDHLDLEGRIRFFPQHLLSEAVHHLLASFRLYRSALSRTLSRFRHSRNEC